MISIKRKDKYQQILTEVQDTPSSTFSYLDNTFIIKEEYKNNYGSCHYSRVFAYLFYLKEILGVIEPGDVLLETTSGSGGRAAAALAKELGYEIHIGIPDGGEKARIKAIKDLDAVIHKTSKEDYVSGFTSFIKRFLKENPKAKYINHSMGDLYGRGNEINRAAVFSLYSIAEEAIKYASENKTEIDFVISPLGNGTSTLAFINVFKDLSDAKIVGLESVSSGYCFSKKYPGKYKNHLGITPTIFPLHDMPGTTPGKTSFRLPALEKSIEDIDDVVLVSSKKEQEIYKKETGKDLPTSIVNRSLPKDFNVLNFKEFGRSGLAALSVAIDLAKETKGKTYFIPIFDAAWHYDK